MRNDFNLNIARDDGEVIIKGYVDNDRNVIITEPEIGGGGGGSEDTIEQITFVDIPISVTFVSNEIPEGLSINADYILGDNKYVIVKMGGESETFNVCTDYYVNFVGATSVEVDGVELTPAETVDGLSAYDMKGLNNKTVVITGV